MEETRVFSQTQSLILACVTVLCIFDFHDVPIFAAEADWLYQAAGLVGRFEQIGASEASLPNKQVDYLHLLDDCAKFSLAPAETERAARARKVVSLMMQRRINEQLGNAASMRHAAEKYEKTKATLPEEEKRTLVLLFERNGAATTPFAPRACRVEARGKDIRVTAVDYPIVELLKRMASAVGKGVRIPPEVSGLVDFDRQDWPPADAAVEMLLLRHGLSSRPDVRDAYAVMVRDPLYKASLAERAREQKVKQAPDTVAEGIKTGYVIAGGCYLEPPYKVEVRADEKQCAVCVNGMQVERSFKLIRPPAPAIPDDTPFTLEDKLLLSAYVNLTYSRLMMKTDDRAAAIKAIGQKLDSLKIVRSWKLDVERNELWITFTDGGEVSAMLPWPGEIERAKKPPGAEEIRTKALAEAQKLKAAVEQLLLANGLLVAPTNNMVFTFKGKEAEEKLRAVCQALQETLRQQERVSDTLFAPMLGTRSDWAWEVFLNLRHRALVQRLTAEGLL